MYINSCIINFVNVEKVCLNIKIIDILKQRNSRHSTSKIERTKLYIFVVVNILRYIVRAVLDNVIVKLFI